MPSQLREKISCSDAPSADADLAVEIDKLTVSYRSYNQRPTTLKESLIQFATSGKVKHYSTFDALKGISLSIRRGEVFGIIGSNGAGKSTLLRTISGVLPPASGEVRINGQIDSLIKLGAGFDSELNAIENIYLYFSLFKVPRKVIKERITGIIEFAELEDFATTPIKYYSSGMAARLGFSVAIDRDPDILIVDEVLAVGDERFQEKCHKVFERYLEERRTVIIVSHSISMLEQMADRIALLSKGELVCVGSPKDAIERYRAQDYVTALKPQAAAS